ncbi:SapC family protein [Sphingomonas oligophenolica]|uniref:SapC family protein n=1 Tax=Sphingomonas oligophenolica TaxID=301154 RepID=A0ABU9Y021_9SPHN
MTEQLELLNVESHGNLRMRIDTGAPHPHFVMVVLSEFPAAASSCPIFFAKDSATGDFYAAALFGFQPGEVLVESAAAGRACFQPLDLQRQGFFASEQNIAIDPAHPRFGAGATVALFEEDGTPSNALRKVQRIIGQLAGGVEATQSFIRELLRLKLIEPIDISLQFDDGERLSLDGLYTVSRDNLNDLDDSDILALFRSGYLQAALCMTFSLNQIAILAQRRNERLTA